jgi:hypothetical protein
MKLIQTLYFGVDQRLGKSGALNGGKFFDYYLIDYNNANAYIRPKHYACLTRNNLLQKKRRLTWLRM